MTLSHVHGAHLPYSYSLMGIVLGVAVLPALLIWVIFLIAKALA